MLPLHRQPITTRLCAHIPHQGECAQRETDSIWGDKAISKLPSRLPDPRNQKSIDFNNRAVSLYRRKRPHSVHPPHPIIFRVDMAENAATSRSHQMSALYALRHPETLLLATDEKMYESANGSSRDRQPAIWIMMLGSYLTTAIGIRNGANGAEYAHHP